MSILLTSDMLFFFFFMIPYMQLFPMVFVNILQVQLKLSCIFETFKLFLNGGHYSEHDVKSR